jgi:hypothetical protein
MRAKFYALSLMVILAALLAGCLEIHTGPWQ